MDPQSGFTRGGGALVRPCLTARGFHTRHPFTPNPEPPRLKYTPGTSEFLGVWVSGLGFRVEGFEFRIQGLTSTSGALPDRVGFHFFFVTLEGTVE